MLQRPPGSTNRTPPTWRHYLKQSIALPSVSSTAWPSAAPRAAASSGATPTFRGAALAIQTLIAPEWILAGPSETGKTYATLYRLDQLLRATPNAQAALMRKVRSTIGPTVLRTYLRVLAMSNSGAVAYGGKNPEWYDYPNGARLWIGGMDDPGKVLSGERDFIYVNQAEELTQDDWETLSTRATGRGAVSSTPMLFGDCNPGPADHWIQRRKEAGSLQLLESKHEDNPSLFDDAGQLTEQGARSMATLDRLTGVRRMRLRNGLWVGAEGAYYTQLDDARHIVAMPDRRGWPVWAALDYGFSHPLSFGVFTIDPWDRVYVIGHHSAHKWYIPQHSDAMDSLLDQLSIDKNGLRIVAGHDCWNAGKDDPETIADKFEKRGYQLERAVISRVLGARAIGERLGNPECDPAIEPTLFFVEQTRAIFDCLARMVHDPKNAEDVLKVNADGDGRGGDDDYDQVRYGCMAALNERMEAPASGGARPQLPRRGL
jgi:hypothetical protein